jgi:hypothetical protein
VLVKTDLKKQVASYQARPGVFSLVQVPPLQYLVVDGHGDPNSSPAYADALASLFPLAYTLKFLSKTELGHDYVVMPLEALWWSDDLASFTSARDKSRWDWTLMTMLPGWITAEHLHTARARVARRAGAPLLDELRLTELAEGLCVQTLHLGPYDEEGPVLRTLHQEFIPGHALEMTGKHHEIYLNDPRRAPAAKLRTILRQPVVERQEGASGSGSG